MTSVRRTPEVVRRFIREATQHSGSNTKQALREHNGPQKPGCPFTPSSLNKTCFCGEGLSLYPYVQLRHCSSRRPRAPVHPTSESCMHDTTHEIHGTETVGGPADQPLLQREFFSLKAPAERLHETNATKENSHESGCCCCLAGNESQSRAENSTPPPSTPTHTTQLLTVSGGGWNHPLTACSCDRRVGGSAA